MEKYSAKIAHGGPTHLSSIHHPHAHIEHATSRLSSQQWNKFSWWWTDHAGNVHWDVRCRKMFETLWLTRLKHVLTAHLGGVFFGNHMSESFGSHLGWYICSKQCENGMKSMQVRSPSLRDIVRQVQLCQQRWTSLVNMCAELHPRLMGRKRWS